MANRFNTSAADSQATGVVPVKSRNFDFERYMEYTKRQNRICSFFRVAKPGVLVYRRMRVAACFSHLCRDMERSLELQLGTLEKSLHFKADVPNFLEPWYGIGTVSGAFGGDYTWIEGNAPALKPAFSSLEEVLATEPAEIADTPIGRHTLPMIPRISRITVPD